jgi:UDP-N-acetylmuramate--alanine ligase
MNGGSSTRVPLDIGPIHFVGIGGIGMSGIAEIMHNLGYNVQGSDAADTANVKRLRKLGIPIKIGHAAENIEGAYAIVYSSAVKPDNVEIEDGRRRGIPLVRRAEMLAEIMRLKWCVAVAGTNGKTTTTTMVAALLDAGGFDPTVVNGGIINAYGTNARIGAGDWAVVEADESDGSFLRLPATIAVLTSADPDHLDYYGTFERMRDAFQRFIENIPFYGFAVLCLDHPEVQSMIGRITDRRLITYGFSPQADVRATNISFTQGGSRYDVSVTDRLQYGGETLIENITLPMPGEHNILNSLAAITVARGLGVQDQRIRTALSAFEGVKRRFSRVGEWNGAAIIDDYGHNPFKIAAALRAARQAYAGPIVAIIQPHRFTRLRDTFEQFCTCLNDADTAIIAPIYAAGEQPIAGMTHLAYADAIRARGHRNVVTIESPEELPNIVAPLAKPGGAIVFLGAGSITNWASGLETVLRARESRA